MDAIGFDSYEDIDKLIGACVKFHNNTLSNNYDDKKIALATHFLHFLVIDFTKMDLVLVVLGIKRKNLTALNCYLICPIHPLKSSRRPLRELLRTIVLMRLQSLRLSENLLS